MSWLKSVAVRWMSSRPGTWFYLHVFPHIDRPLLRLTRGRVSITLGQPILLLTTLGAKTRQVRSTPLVYVREGDCVAVIASNGGQRRHPAWYYNLRAHPEAGVILPGYSGCYRAHEATGQEREDLWQKALRVYPGYAAYQKRAGARIIPIMVLTPIEGSAGDKPRQ